MTEQTLIEAPGTTLVEQDISKPKNDYLSYSDQMKELATTPVEPKPPVEEVELPDEQSEDDDTPEPERGEKAKRGARGGNWKAKNERLQQELADERAKRIALETISQTKQSEQPPVKTPVAAADAPKLEDFEDINQYVEAIADYKVNKALEAKDKEAREANLRQEIVTKEKTFNDRLDDARDRYDDFDDVVAEAQASNNVRFALLDSEHAGDLAYYLASNPTVLAKLNGLPPSQLNREIGRLEARFEARPERATAEPIKGSKAPPPITPITSKTSGTTKKLDDMPYEEYKRARSRKA